VARWSRNVWAGFVSGGLLAFSPLIWRYAVVAEVFALNNLLIATLLYLGVRYFDKKEQIVANCAAFFCGLALSNHHTSVFYGFPLFVLLVISRYQEERSWRPLLRLSGLATLGLLPYVYLPLASRQMPLISWGDQTTLGGFLNHLLRRDYGTFRLH